jgi:hypothetical protein
MSNLEKRLEAFRQLPLRAQLALITSTRSNRVLAQNTEYIEGLKRVHAECLLEATPQQKADYEKARVNLTQNRTDGLL